MLRYGVLMQNDSGYNEAELRAKWGKRLFKKVVLEHVHPCFELKVMKNGFF